MPITISRINEGLIRADDVCCRGGGSVTSGPPASSQIWTLFEVNPGVLLIGGGSPGHIFNNTDLNSNDQRHMSELVGLVDPTQLLFQANVLHANGSFGGLGIIARAPAGGSTSRVGLSWMQAAGTWVLQHNLTSDTAITGPSPLNNWRVIRLWIEDRGENAGSPPERDLRLHGYVHSSAGADSQDLGTTAPTLQGTRDIVTSSNPVAGWAGGSYQRLTRKAMFSICVGRTIKMVNMPNGWKLQVDSIASVVAVGNQAEVAMQAEFWPATEVKLLDPSDTVMATFDSTVEPAPAASAGQTQWPANAWPGDVFSVQGAGGGGGGSINTRSLGPSPLPWYVTPLQPFAWRRNRGWQPRRGIFI